MSAITFNVFKAIARSRQRHRAIMRLQRLDDRLLRDIGIERINIEGIVRGAMRERLRMADHAAMRPASASLANVHAVE